MLAKGRAEAMLAACGLAMVASQVLLVQMTRGLTDANAATIHDVVPMILGLAIPAGALLLAAPALLSVPSSRLVWIVLIAVGVAMRLCWIGTPPPIETDFYRYLWDGALVAHGLDPYAHAPDVFHRPGAGPEAYRQLAEQAQPILHGVNYPYMRTIYPSVAQASFALAHWLAPFSVDGLRIVLLAAELATFGLLVVALRALGRPATAALLYWWNPLMAAMLVGLAHVDALIPPLVLGALLAYSRGGPNTALALLGLGAGVKIWPVLLAPMVLWPLLRQPRRLALGCAVLGATLALAVGPVVLSMRQPGSGLSAYAAAWSNNNGFYAWLLYGAQLWLGSWEAAERLVRPLLALTAAGIAVWAAISGQGTLRSLAPRALLVAAAVFYLSPAQFPWYSVWFVPLAVLCGSWPLLLATALLPFYYLSFPLWIVRDGAWFFFGASFIHSVPVMAWLLVEAVRSRRAGRAVTVAH